MCVRYPSLRLILVLLETGIGGAWECCYPLLPIHTSSLAHPYFFFCPDIPSSLPAHSINYGVVFINRDVVCTNRDVVFINCDVVYRISAQGRRNIRAKEEVWMSKRGSMDAGRGAANWEVPPRATSLGYLFLLIQPHRLPVLRIVPWISPRIWRIEKIALPLRRHFGGGVPNCFGDPLKREPGENPGQTRYCKLCRARAVWSRARQVSAKTPATGKPGRRPALKSKSGNLPR